MGEPLSTVILPTGKCFDDALDFVEWRLLENPELAHHDNLLVVHGICLVPEDQARAGELFAHAWVEENNVVWQAGLVDGQRVFYGMQLLDFLTELRVQESTRYTLLEAARHNHASCHYGPWEPRYEALCRVGPREGSRAEVQP